MTGKGTSIIFINDRREILLLLRDNNPCIPFPNMWDLPGGHVEEGETPEACIVREMKEEMGIELTNFQLFLETRFADRLEYVYWKRQNIIISDITLMEGQRLKWFTEDAARKTELACCFSRVVEDFYRIKPFLNTR